MDITVNIAAIVEQGDSRFSQLLVHFKVFSFYVYVHKMFGGWGEMNHEFAQRGHIFYV